jgi:hypothetical protein
MLPFTSRLPVAGDKELEFQFQPFFCPGGFRYQVSVTDSSDATHCFHMERDPYAGWRIINAPKVEDWILGLEAPLGSAIEQLPPPVPTGQD